jgi:hypothetical protein
MPWLYAAVIRKASVAEVAELWWHVYLTVMLPTWVTHFGRPIEREIHRALCSFERQCEQNNNSGAVDMEISGLILTI